MKIPHSERRVTLYETLIAHVEICKDSSCWVWQKGDSGNGRGGGYGRVYFEGQMIAVHRAMYILVHGYLHRWQQVDHTCCNRRCINPEHLEAVKHAENQKRKVKRVQIENA